MSDIVERLKRACVGHPHAKIPWPHRLLHDASDEIIRLREALSWYADEDRYDYDQTCCYDGPLDDSDGDNPAGVLEDHGERAKKALGQAFDD